MITDQNSEAKSNAITTPTLDNLELVENPSMESQSLTPEQKKMTIIGVVGLVAIVVLIIGSLVFLLNQPPLQVARFRDIFIIFMAFVSILTGLALVILMVQLARLINLLQNEIKPIMDSTNETISNLRGTTVFLSENLVGPVIKLNEYLAGFSQFVQVIGLMRKPRNQSNPKEN